MKLLGSDKRKITKDENIPHVEVTKVVLVYCNIVNKSYQLNSRVCIHLLLINCLVNS